MIEVKNLRRTFGDLVAVDDISFKVADGEFTGFVGGNGAGKTTTMRMIMGLLTPDAGEVLWQGKLITTKDRSQFGYMPEERGLYPKQSLLSQLTYLGELHGMTNSQARTASQKLLTRFGLGDRTKDKLETLSLGNQQRVQIAAAVLADPIGLVLDEPFSGLDPDAVDEMHGLLSEFASRGIPILFSSHQLDLVEQLCDRIVILAKGKVVANGTVAELKTVEDQEYQVHCASDLGWLRDAAGVQVRDVAGNQALVTFADEATQQQVLQQAITRGPVYAFAPVNRPLSEIYREVTR